LNQLCQGVGSPAQNGRLADFLFFGCHHAPCFRCVANTQ
jgi:hypothetical protein